jgi:hypothetical protein
MNNSDGLWESFFIAIDTTIRGEVSGALFMLSLALNALLIAPYVWAGVRNSWRSVGRNRAYYHDRKDK